MREQGLTFTHEWEKPTSAMLNEFLAHHDRPPKIILVGMSMGGFLAPRAAAFDDRVDGVVAFDVFYDVSETVRRYVPSIAFWLHDHKFGAVVSLLVKVKTFFVLAEASRLGVDLKKPVDRLGLVSCRLGHAFGRASGRRTQEEADFFRGENAAGLVHQGSLADTWAAGDHHYFRAQRGVDRRLLAVGKRQASACFHPRDGLLGIDGFPGQRSAQENAQPIGDRALGK